MSESLRIGLIGHGTWGSKIAATIVRLNGFELAAASTKNRLVHEKYQSTDTEIYDRPEDLLAHDGLDGLVIATPPSSHKRLLMQGVGLGLPIFIEKPLTLSEEDNREILGLLRERKAMVLVDHIYRFHAGFQTLLGNLGHVGKIREIESYGGNQGPIRADYSSLWDYSPHDLSMVFSVRKMLPTDISVTRTLSKKTESGYGENFDISFNLNDIKVKVCVGSAFETRTRWFRVTGDQGVLLFADEPDKPMVQFNGKEIPVRNKSWPLDRALIAFGEMVKDKDFSTDSVEISVLVAEILSHFDGETVSTPKGSTRGIAPSR